MEEFESSSSIRQTEILPLNYIRVGATGGIRTHTLQILSLLTLPVGLQSRWYEWWDSNPHFTEFEPVPSAGWSTLASVITSSS